MAEELTTLMHSEFIGDEISLGDLKILGVYGAIRRGLTKNEALREYDISEKEYDQNIERVLKS